METNNQNLTNEIDYVGSFEKPAEFDFLDNAQKKKLQAEEEKLKKTLTHFKIKFGDTKWSEKLDKEILKGDVYTSQQAQMVEKKFQALNWYGERENVEKSLVTPTGQRVIMSPRCADALGMVMDSYFTSDGVDELVNVLKEEGVEQESIDNIKKAAQKYGLILVQNGIFTELESFVSDYVESHPIAVKPPIIPTATIPAAPTPIPVTPAAVPPPAPAAKPIVSAPPTAEMTTFEKKLAEISAQEPARHALGDLEGAMADGHGESLEVLKRKLEGASSPKPSGISAAEIKREVETVELPGHADLVKALPQGETASTAHTENLRSDSQLKIDQIAALAAPRKITEIKPVFTPKPIAMPPPPPRVISVPKVSPPPPKPGLMALRSLDIVKSLDDLRKIEPGHLRQGALGHQISLIKNKIAEQAYANQILPYYVMNAFEQSPLFKAYVQTGNAKFSGVVSGSLTQDEFEAVADLKRQISQM